MTPSSITIVIVTLVILAACKPPPDAYWQENVVLNDGASLDVKRGISFRHGSTFDQVTHWYPDAHSLDFRHPHTGKIIHWSGESGVEPIAVYVTQDSAYLVVLSDSGTVFTNQDRYGCPSFPFAFLVNRSNSLRWEPVPPTKAPQFLNKVNLTVVNSQWRDGWVDSRMIRYNYGLLSDRTIPRSTEEWTYRNKKRELTKRYPNDCRPALPVPIDVVFPQDEMSPIQNTKAEIVGVTNYSPEKVIKSIDWAGYYANMESIKLCDELLYDAGTEDARLEAWRAFAHDPTKKRATRNSSNWICHQDAIWFFSGNRVAKTTIYGEVIYRMKVTIPVRSSMEHLDIVPSSFRAESGFIYFDILEKGLLWNADTRNEDYLIKKITSVRISEPKDALRNPSASLKGAAWN